MKQSLRRAGFFLLLSSPGLFPLLVPYLPFQDWPMNMGLVAGLDALSDPEAPFWKHHSFRGWIGPNRLFYLLAWAFASLVGPHWGAQIVLALSLAALGPSAYLLLSASGGDKRWALAFFPLCLPRILFCGFGPNLIALLGLYWALAAVFKLSQENSWKWFAVFVLGLSFSMLTHAFVGLVCLGLSLLLVLSYSQIPFFGKEGTFAQGKAWTGLLIGALVTVVFARVPAEPSQSKQSALKTIWDALHLPEWKKLRDTFWDWLFASLRTAEFDDGLQASWLVFVGLALLLPQRKQLANYSRIVLLLFATLVVFIIVPENIGPPINWWGGNLRLPIVIGALLVLLAAQSHPQRFSFLRFGASVSGICLFFSLAIYTAYFSQKEMKGFEEVSQKIPRREVICAMHYPNPFANEFPGAAHWYVGNYHLARGGAGNAHNMFGNPSSMIARNEQRQAPGWGIAWGFNRARHVESCDGFLVRVYASRPKGPFERFARVKLIAESGNWRYYRKLEAAPKPKKATPPLRDSAKGRMPG